MQKGGIFRVFLCNTPSASIGVCDGGVTPSCRRSASGDPSPLLPGNQTRQSVPINPEYPRGNHQQLACSARDPNNNRRAQHDPKPE